MNTLLKETRSLVEQFLNDYVWQADEGELFFNECDFQLQLARHLERTLPEDCKVFTEYFVPFDEMEDYQFMSEVYVDIVVQQGESFVPIELKYKTRPIADRVLWRFGERMRHTVLKNHQASPDNRYQFWKDAHRLDTLTRRFACVEGGLAVLLTNQPAFANPTSGSGEAFSLCPEQVKSPRKYWKDTDRELNGFELSQNFLPHWDDNGKSFRHCIVEVS